MTQPTPEELEAVRIKWRSLHPEAPRGDGPTPDDIATLLPEIRARAAGIERQVLASLRKATRNDWSRSGWRSRYMQAFFLYVVLTAALGVIILAILNSLGQR